MAAVGLDIYAQVSGVGPGEKRVLVTELQTEYLKTNQANKIHPLTIAAKSLALQDFKKCYIVERSGTKGRSKKTL